MLFPAIEECIDRVGCKYTLATIVGQRTKELTAKNAVHKTAQKELSMALEEVAEGKIIVAVKSNSKI